MISVRPKESARENNTASIQLLTVPVETTQSSDWPGIHREEIGHALVQKVCYKTLPRSDLCYSHVDSREHL
jgi:hypothetical protein